MRKVLISVSIKSRYVKFSYPKKMMPNFHFLAIPEQFYPRVEKEENLTNCYFCFGRKCKYFVKFLPIPPKNWHVWPPYTWLAVSKKFFWSRAEKEENLTNIDKKVPRCVILLSSLSGTSHLSHLLFLPQNILNFYSNITSFALGQKKRKK